MAKSMRTTNQEVNERSVRRSAQVPGDGSSYTPIPLRASAHPVAAVKARARFPRISMDEDEEDIAHIRTRPQTARQLAEIEKLIFTPSPLALPLSPLPAISIEVIATLPPPLSASREEELEDLSSMATVPQRSSEDEEPYEVSIQLLDHLRWWLLQPGRLEMIFWVIGTLLLISITGFLMFILAMSLGGSVKMTL